MFSQLGGRQSGLRTQTHPALHVVASVGKMEQGDWTQPVPGLTRVWSSFSTCCLFAVQLIPGFWVPRRGKREHPQRRSGVHMGTEEVSGKACHSSSAPWSPECVWSFRESPSFHRRSHPLGPLDSRQGRAAVRVHVSHTFARGPGHPSQPKPLDSAGLRKAAA